MITFSKDEISEIASLIRSCSVWSEMVKNGIRKHSNFDETTEEGRAGLHENVMEVQEAMKWHDSDAKKLNEMLGEDAVTLFYN
jgi:hypothetical protein